VLANAGPLSQRRWAVLVVARPAGLSVGAPLRRSRAAPVVSLKLASTSWRAVRYYTGGAEYRRLGPPQIVLRALAPVLLIATVALFGSGVAFLAVSGTHPLRTIHTFALLVWGVLMIVHVLA
jgi:hypothetical protein